MSELLRENRPDVAEFVERWKSKYNRSYDLNSMEEQATFYEGVTELAKHIAIDSKTASLEIQLAVDGVVGVKVNSN